MTTVGLAGTGRMGTAMARSLARAGVPLVLYNRTPEPAAALAAELGAGVARTPAELAGRTDVTLTMLADDAALEHVYGGRDGLLAGVRPGSVLVDLSTVTPSTIRSLGERAGRVGARLLDAPVSGSVTTAETGQLTLMVGGDEAALELARPVLEPLAKHIFHVGPLGTGAAMKLAVNTVIFGLNGALAEGLVLAEAAGIDRAAAYEVLMASAAGAPFLAYKRSSFVDPATAPVAFALELAEKDLRLITSLAADLAVPVPQALANLAQVRAASSGGRGGLDFSAVAEELRAAAARLDAGTRHPTEEGTPP